MTETYGQRIARLRAEIGWSQKELAERSGVAIRTIQDVEADRRQMPQRGTRIALNRVLEIEEDAGQTRQSWPDDVQVFLDVLGAFLDTMGPQERRAKIRELTRLIVGGR